MKKWYLKLDQNNFILDIIEYPYEDYIEVEMPNLSLPSGINGGWFKLEDGIEGNKVFVEYPELKPVTRDDQIDHLKTRLTESENAIMALMDMSMMMM